MRGLAKELEFAFIPWVARMNPFGDHVNVNCVLGLYGF